MDAARAPGLESATEPAGGMRDLTEGRITSHILAMAGPTAIGLIVQTMYYIVDLYFVAQLGDAAIAGVSVLLFINMALIFWIIRDFGAPA